MKYSRDLSKPLAPTFGGGRVVTKTKTTTKGDGTKSVTKTKQVKKKGIIKKTKTKVGGIKEKEVERGKNSKYVLTVDGKRQKVERSKI